MGVNLCQERGTKNMARNKKYGEELKIRAVKSYLEGERSQPEICRKCRISRHKQIKKFFVKLHNIRKFQPLRQSI